MVGAAEQQLLGLLTWDIGIPCAAHGCHTGLGRDTEDFVENRLKPAIIKMREKGFRVISTSLDSGSENLAV